MRRLLSVALLFAVTGCAHLAGDAAKGAAEEATPTAINSALRTLDTPENRALLSHVLANPEVRDAARRMGEGFTDGMLASLSEKADNSGFEFHPDSLAREFSKGMVLGVDDALQELDAKRAQGQPTGLLARMSHAANEGIQFTTVALAVLGVFLLVLAIVVARLVIQTRQERVAAARREAAMDVMANAIRSTESKNWSPELRRVLETQIRVDGAGKAPDLRNDQHDGSIH